MLEAAIWGLIGASSLVLGAIVALTMHPGHRIIGLLMAFGAGMLITSVSYELVGDAIADGDAGSISVAMLIGALVYYAADRYIEGLGGDRPGLAASGEQIGGAPAIVVGAVLDGIPESFVLGLTVVSGSVNVALLAAVFVSNIPEALSSTAGLAEGSWSTRAILSMWTLIVVVSGLAAFAGYAYFTNNNNRTGKYVQAFAAGAILAMLTEAMMPDGFKFGGRLAGVFTVLGFIAGMGLNSV